MRTPSKFSLAVILPTLATAQSLVTVPVVINGYTTSIAIPAYSGQSTIEATVTIAVASQNPAIIYGTYATAAPSNGGSSPSSLAIVPVPAPGSIETASTEVPLATNAPAALTQPYGSEVTPPVIVVPPASTQTANAISQTITTTNAAGESVPLIVPIPAILTTYSTTISGSPVVVITQAANSVASGAASSAAAVGSAANSAAASASAAASSAAQVGSAAASNAAASASQAASNAVASASSAAASASQAAASAAASISSEAASASASASSVAGSLSSAAASASGSASSAIASASASASHAVSSLTRSLSTITGGTSSSPTAPVPTATNANASPDIRLPGVMIAMSCMLTITLAWVLSA